MNASDAFPVRKLLLSQQDWCLNKYREVLSEECWQAGTQLFVCELGSWARWGAGLGFWCDPSFMMFAEQRNFDLRRPLRLGSELSGPQCSRRVRWGRIQGDRGDASPPALDPFLGLDETFMNLWTRWIYCHVYWIWMGHALYVDPMGISRDPQVAREISMRFPSWAVQGSSLPWSRLVDWSINDHRCRDKFHYRRIAYAAGHVMCHELPAFQKLQKKLLTAGDFVNSVRQTIPLQSFNTDSCNRYLQTAVEVWYIGSA